MGIIAPRVYPDVPGRGCGTWFEQSPKLGAVRLFNCVTLKMSGVGSFRPCKKAAKCHDESHVIAVRLQYQ